MSSHTVFPLWTCSERGLRSLLLHAKTLALRIMAHFYDPFSLSYLFRALVSDYSHIAG